MISYRRNHICFRRYDLQTLESIWITFRQIEVGRLINVRRDGQICVRIFLDKSFTVKPTETRMDFGKNFLNIG